MNYYGIWAISLLLGFTGCSGGSLNSQVPVTPPATTAAPLPIIEPVQSSALQAQEPAVGATEPQIQQDYAATAPLPATGKVTIRESIRNLDLSQLLAECPADSAPYAFAESTNYRVQICSQEYDPWLPKYYIGQAKDGSGELRITSSDPDEARQLIFKHEGYTYIIYRDGARPEQVNAYLEVYTPSGENYAEALLYLYEAGAAPN